MASATESANPRRRTVRRLWPISERCDRRNRLGGLSLERRSRLWSWRNSSNVHRYGVLLPRANDSMVRSSGALLTCRSSQPMRRCLNLCVLLLGFRHSPWS